MRNKAAKNLCSNKWATTMSQRCGWYDTATDQKTNGPCDAWTSNQCPYMKDRSKASKNYNFCSCMPSAVTN